MTADRGCCEYSLYFDVLKGWQYLLSYIPDGIIDDKHVVIWLEQTTRIGHAKIRFAQGRRNEIAHPLKDVPVSEERATEALKIIRQVAAVLGGGH